MPVEIIRLSIFNTNICTSVEKLSILELLSVRVRGRAIVFHKLAYQHHILNH